MAFAATAVFLHMNGFNVKVGATIAETFIIEKLIKGKAELEQIADWLEKIMKEIK